MNKEGYIFDKMANLVTIRDPMVLTVGDTYYVTGTQMPYWKGVNDGVHLWSSKDLREFTHCGIILARSSMPSEMWCRDRFWAPEIFDGGNGWFYLTVSCRNESEEHPHEFGVLLARARQITGPYEIVSVDKPFTSGIDGTIFRDSDGRFYIGHAGGKKLNLDEFDPETGEILWEQTVCHAGEEGEWDSIGIEGQCIVCREGKYFQWYSSWTDANYRAGLLIADSIRGPWVKSPHNPVLKEDRDWVKGGHNHSFRGLDGKDYIVFHAMTPDSKGEALFFERMYIREIVYHADGTVSICSDAPAFMNKK